MQRTIKNGIRLESEVLVGNRSVSPCNTQGGAARAFRVLELRFLWLPAALVASLALRILSLDFESGDYRMYLSRWYDYLLEHGRWDALKDNFSSYHPLYLSLLSLSTWLPIPKLYAIKSISIAFDYVAAWFVFRIVQLRFPHGHVAVAAGISFLFLPTVFLNSSVWGQCDVLYTTALLATLYWILQGKPAAALAAYGVACALKPQAVFFAPFLLGLFMNGALPWKLVPVPALVYALCGLPGLLAGKPWREVLFHWALQRNKPGLTLGATNWYQWVPARESEILAGCGYALAAAASLFLAFRMGACREGSRSSRDQGSEGLAGKAVHAPVIDHDSRRRLVTAALASVLIVPYFLPGMHERYFFPADALALVYAFYIPKRWIVPWFVQFASLFAYFPFLFRQEPVPRPLLAVVVTAALVVVAYDFVRKHTHQTTVAYREDHSL